MDRRLLNLCFVAICLLLCLNVNDVESKRSFGLIRSRPKPNNLNVRRRQQAPVQYTPQSAANVAPAKPAVASKPVASAPAAPAPAGPPPPYSAHPVKNIPQSNAAPPPYNPHHAAPPSYQSAMGHGSPYPNANYPRQPYPGVNQGPYNQGHPGMGMGGGVGQSPYGGGGVYNNYNGGMGMGGQGMAPGMAMGGMGMGMGGMGGGMGGMGGGMGMGGMGMGGYGYAQKPKSLFSASNVLTGLALYSVARGIGGGGLFGGGGYGGGYGHSSSQPQHVYLHHMNQPTTVVVQGVPVQVQPGVQSIDAQPINPINPNSGVQPLAPTYPFASTNITTDPNGVTETPASAFYNPIPATNNCTENCNPNVDPQMPTEIPPMGLDAYPTIHPSLFTYAGGSEDILYWANTFNKTLTQTVDTTRSSTSQSVTVSDMTV